MWYYINQGSDTMVDFVNINQQIRNMLKSKFFEFVTVYGKEEASIKYFEFFDNLKYDNNNLYKIIIGLGFIDHLRLLIDKEAENFITDEEKSTLEIYDTIDDPSDLLFKIDQDPFLLQGIIFAPIKYHSLNIVGQAQLFSKLDDQYVAKFNKFYYFEKHQLFKDRTIEDFIKIYLDVVQEKEDNEALKHEARCVIANTLNVLSIGNPKNYVKNILKMVKESYKFKKAISKLLPKIFFDVDSKIIELLENKSINDIVNTIYNDKELLMIIIEDFFSYELSNSEMKKEIDSLFDLIASKDVKSKLKGV